ncbi:MAG: CRISPR-associated helicase Cas3' [Blastocatellia bacterium]|nr:CRISPR-associated helicase Cas3' [Blastocatellia bacterium]
MNDKPLLAKSYNRNDYPDFPPDYALLMQHSRDVAEACRAFSKREGRQALLVADLGQHLEEPLFACFSRTLTANGWIQDIGKANSHFQAMVSGKSDAFQLLRHETISGLLFWQDERLRQWLKPLGDDFLLALWGAIGHHRKFEKSTQPRQVAALRLHLTHRDVATIFNEMSADLRLDPPPAFSADIAIAVDRHEVCDWQAKSCLEDLLVDFIELESEFEDEKKRRLLALIKAFGIAADVAASAVARREKQNYSLTKFIDEGLHEIGISSAEFTALIHKWAWDNANKNNAPRDESVLPPGFVYRNFQDDVAASDSLLTLARAGCGSGKSLSAYRWAQAWCERVKRQNFRLFFCLPTTGTTTEHFKDYALESGIESSLTHSRAEVDLLAMAQTAAQEEAAESENDTAKAAQAALNAEREKIEALALWSTPLVVTTADTVLGLMANARRSIYSFPAIINSAIVFDEIHAFDERMFGHLLVFLKNFPKLPVLLMTASLPEERLKAIAAIRPDFNLDSDVIEGPAELETRKRYTIEEAGTQEEIWERVRDCVAHKGKVLWVRNRVEWANDIYFECRAKFKGIYSNVYHSRFRYLDRSHRHREVIDRFKLPNQAAILVATQVAEMSLNLSADLLITDIAPIASLIQRMGRLNRFAEKDDPKPAIICPVSENDTKPYEEDDLALTKRWVERLKGRALNQRDLSQAFFDLRTQQVFDYAEAERHAPFFSGLWETRPGQTREDGYTVSVILANDLKECQDWSRKGEPSSRWLRAHEVAIPFKPSVLQWQRCANLRVAPSNEIEYLFEKDTKEGVGARWK